MDTQMPEHEVIFNLFSLLVEKLKTRESSRANSETITLVETATMWFNKDRANKGEIKPNETHIA